ncbi:MAG: LapA family protein [Pontiella sp.]|nr:LapA family protein [Pontiella sp.]MBT8045997.1 LapA family protein [Pontiella sp.]NNJ71249.1 LapA family protein [Kiritimatiellales bacterium]
MVKVKLYTALTLILLVLIVVFQNTEPVETKCLFVTVTMPRAALLAITLLIGIAAGMLLSLGLAKKIHKKD